MRTSIASPHRTSKPTGRYVFPILERDPFPHCALYGERIVAELRRTCPLSRRDPLDALGSLERLGWRRYASGDTSGGIRVMDRAAICGPCIPELIRHPVIVNLRAGLEGKA